MSEDDYEYEVVPEFECGSCGRVTLSMLCGCETPKPAECGRIWFGRPARGVVGETGAPDVAPLRGAEEGQT